jgi:hypothetical protein
MVIGLIMLIIILIWFLLAMIRNTYTWHCSNIARDLISKYTDYLIEKKQYSSTINYYDEMKLDYNKHFLSIWLWGKYSMIKPQYQELLKKIEKMQEKRIVNIIYDDIKETDNN